MKIWTFFLLSFSLLMGNEATFSTNEFLSPSKQIKYFFTISFPEEPALLEFPNVDQIIYGAKDEREMEYGVTVVSAERLQKLSSLSRKKVNHGALLDSYLASLKKSGEFLLAGKKKIPSIYLEEYEVLLIHKEGHAIRGRLIRTRAFIFVLCTRIFNDVYLTPKAMKNSPAVQKDNQRSTAFFKSFKIHS